MVRYSQSEITTVLKTMEFIGVLPTALRNLEAGQNRFMSKRMWFTEISMAAVVLDVVDFLRVDNFLYILMGKMKNYYKTFMQGDL